MASRTCQAIILAAGQGTRMKSQKAKVLHEIAGLPMIGHVTRVASKAGVDKVSLIIGPNMDDVHKVACNIHPSVLAHIQTERLGTGHAVMAARDDLAEAADDIIVLFGDTPLLRSETILAMREKTG